MHFIMNKDIPVIRIEDTKILDWRMCPKALALKNLSIDKIYKWLNNRALPLTRKNADKVYQVMGLAREDYLGLMYVTHALSINDNFWVASDEELGVIGYDQISIFRNSFNNAMYLVALRGMDGFSIQQNIISAEFTGQGTYPKCFIRRPDGIYLCKHQNNNEITNEIISAYIAQIIGFNSVTYTYEKVYGLDCSVSKILSNENVNWESAFDVTEAMEQITGKIPQDFALERYSRDYANLIIFDALILNDDRHMKNWAFEICAKTNEIIGIAPSYDYNKAFQATGQTMSQLIFNGNKRMNILIAAREAYCYFGTNLNLELLLNNLDNIPNRINKKALENRILFITGLRSSTRDCY